MPKREKGRPLRIWPCGEHFVCFITGINEDVFYKQYIIYYTSIVVHHDNDSVMHSRFYFLQSTVCLWRAPPGAERCEAHHPGIAGVSARPPSAGLGRGRPSWVLNVVNGGRGVLYYCITTATMCNSTNRDCAVAGAPCMADEWSPWTTLRVSVLD